MLAIGWAGGGGPGRNALPIAAEISHTMSCGVCKPLRGIDL